jgi:hypothetical protein
VHERSSDRDSLLFTSRERAREMSAARAKPKLLKDAMRLPLSVARARPEQLERERDVLER